MSQRTLGIGLVALVVLVIAFGMVRGMLGGSPTGPAPAARPGNPAVYSEIDSSTDCAYLQDKFDTASDNFDRAIKGTDQADWSLGYMNAADSRMKVVGCY